VPHTAGALASRRFWNQRVYPHSLSSIKRNNNTTERHERRWSQKDPRDDPKPKGWAQLLGHTDPDVSIHKRGGKPAHAADTMEHGNIVNKKSCQEASWWTRLT